MRLPPPPRLGAAALLWWGLGLFLGQMAFVWLYSWFINDISKATPAYQFLTDNYMYLSPVLWLVQTAGSVMIAGAFIVRSLGGSANSLGKPEDKQSAEVEQSNQPI